MSKQKLQKIERKSGENVLRTFYASVKSESINEKDYTADFILSTDQIDRHNEVVDQDTWELDNFIKAPRLLLQHEHNNFPIGRWEKIWVTEENGVKMLCGTAKFAYEEYDQAKIAFDLVKGGFLNTISVGFRPEKWEYSEETGVWTAYNNELLEASLVSIPANPNALMKSESTTTDKEGEIKEILKEATDKITESISSDEVEGKSVERKKQAHHLILKAIRKVSKDLE